MSSRFNVLLVLAVLAVVVIRMSVFTVDEREHVLKLQFGEIIKADYEPGLHFKWPLVNNILRYPDLTLTHENNEERFLTGEKKNLIVDYFVTWRIADPAEYYTSVRGDEELAVQRLSAIVQEGIKAAISRRTLREVVSAERSELLDSMLVDARTSLTELGINVVDVRVKRIDLAPEVSDSVYMRMSQERQRVATQLRAEGEEEAERIRADAERQRTIILAEAYRDAERLRGEGDAQAAAIYSQAHRQNPEFYSFYRSMLAYEEAIGGAQDVLVLEPDSEFFRFLKSETGTPAAAAAE